MTRIMSYVSIALILLVIVTFANAAQVCPEYPYIAGERICNSTCLPNNDTCPKGRKCCYRPTTPCGFHCVVAKDNVQKPGNCTAAPDNPSWNIRAIET